ncbi:hypothetical protein [Paraburkholderia terrae]|uniref:hypothetical protein n=1 Tax=Paraburkholderia terrae TaxID=311230 RepID=UPI00205305EE|nr:hypothetical protein [Paraburkholderia terrae]BDC46043.1 hypothetical protein PTKU15_93400 [Paraburkholderia terrae]
MALSLDSIYTPLSGFFLDRYKTADGSAVVFRFDKYGSVISEDDFVDPAHPEMGYSSNLVREKFSDLVNHIPQDLGDGMNVAFRQDTIDDAYFLRLLSPALPCANGPIADAFNTLKASALNTWHSIRLESSTGLMLEYRPCLASPVEWYDTGSQDVWTTQTFSISSNSATPAQPQGPVRPPSPLWRLKLDDVAMRSALSESNVDVIQPSPVRNCSPIARMRAVTAVSPALATQVVAPDMTTTPEPYEFPLHDGVRTQLPRYNIGERFRIAQAIDASAPTRQAETESITVSFDYCLVNVRRPWYTDSFIADSNWCVPPLLKGGVTSNAQGTSFASVPIGFVVVKNLSIVAEWPAADLASAAQATSFGPFKVESGIAKGTLAHTGVQIIGWLLQVLPPLPPNDAPCAVATVASQAASA